MQTMSILTCFNGERNRFPRVRGVGAQTIITISIIVLFLNVWYNTHNKMM